FHVKPDGCNVARSLCRLNDMLEQLPEYSTAARINSHVHTLQPPIPTVSPIAPFQSYGDLAEDFITIAGQIIHALVLIVKQRKDPASNRRAVKLGSFAFFS